MLIFEDFELSTYRLNHQILLVDGEKETKQKAENRTGREKTQI
jgi:hypothetical protein